MPTSKEWISCILLLQSLVYGLSLILQGLYMYASVLCKVYLLAKDCLISCIIPIKLRASQGQEEKALLLMSSVGANGWLGIMSVSL